MNGTINFGKNKLSISETKNLEMYGAFKIDNFNIETFNKNEITVIHNGIKNEEKPFEYMIIESAFNETNVQDMINKIKRDRIILEKMIGKKILYCGISNGVEVFNSNLYFNYDFIIIELKSTKLFGKDISKYYDFENGKDIKTLKCQIEELKSGFVSVESRVSSQESRVSSLESRINALESRVGSLESRVGSVENVLMQLVNEIRTLNSKLTQFIDKNK